MRCPKCGFISFDHLDTCRRCGEDLRGSKKDKGISSAPITLPSPRPPAGPTSDLGLPAATRPQPSAPPPPGKEGGEDSSIASEPILRPRAGFWIRFLGSLLDGIIFNLLMGILLASASLAIFGGAAFSGDPDEGKAMVGTLMLVFVALTPILAVTYSVGFVGRRGQTPGKMALRIKIIQTSGSEMTYGRAFLRWLGQIASSLILGTGYLMIAFSRNKQGLHDFIAQTYVIRLR